MEAVVSLSSQPDGQFVPHTVGNSKTCGYKTTKTDLKPHLMFVSSHFALSWYLFFFQSSPFGCVDL